MAIKFDANGIEDTDLAMGIVELGIRLATETTMTDDQINRELALRAELARIISPSLSAQTLQ